MHHLFGIQNLAHLEYGSFGQLRALAKMETLVSLGRAVALQCKNAAGRKGRAQGFGDAFADPVHAGRVSRLHW